MWVYRYFLVRSCLLITLIKCCKGHNSLGSLCSVVKTLIVSLVRQTNQGTKGQGHLLSCSGQLKTNKQQKNNLEPSFLNQNKHTHNRGAGNAFITFGEDQDGKKWRQADSIDFPTVWRKIPRRSRRLWINSFPLQVGRTMTRTRRDVHQRLQNTRRHFFPVVKRKSQSSLIEVAPSRSCNISHS